MADNGPEGQEGLPGLEGQPGPIVRQEDVGLPSQGGKGGKGGRGGDASRQRPIARELRRILILTVSLYLLLGVLGVYVYLDATEKRQDIKAVAKATADLAYSTAVSVCAYKASEEKRMKTTQDYIVDHPQGTADISLLLLKRSVRNSQATLKSLRAQKCPAKKPIEE